MYTFYEIFTRVDEGPLKMSIWKLMISETNLWSTHLLSYKNLSKTPYHTNFKTCLSLITQLHRQSVTNLVQHSLVKNSERNILMKQNVDKVMGNISLSLNSQAI